METPTRPLRVAALALLAVACHGASPPRAPEAATKTAGASPREEFERLPEEDASGTWKLRTRSQMVEGGPIDRAKQSNGDFLGRLTALFGAAEPFDDGFSYVLRHRSTGIVVTAYSGGSGPSYGGGYVLASSDAGPPDLQQIHRRLASEGPREPAGFDAVVRRLDALVDATKPVDCLVVYETDEGVAQSGVRNGVPFDEDAPLAALVGYYEKKFSGEERDPELADAVARLRTIADQRVLEAWRDAPGERTKELAPVVRRAWERLLAATEAPAAREAHDVLAEADGMFRAQSVSVLAATAASLGADSPRDRARLGKLRGR